MVNFLKNNSKALQPLKSDSNLLNIGEINLILTEFYWKNLFLVLRKTISLLNHMYIKQEIKIQGYSLSFCFLGFFISRGVKGLVVMRYFLMILLK